MCHMYMSVPGVQKRATDLLEMELQVVGYKLGVKTVHLEEQKGY